MRLRLAVTGNEIPEHRTLPTEDGLLHGSHVMHSQFQRSDSSLLWC